MESKERILFLQGYAICNFMRQSELGLREPLAAVRTRPFKETVNSPKGSPIGVRGFLDGSLSMLSGAFFSSHRYLDCPKPEESKFDFLHNPTAAVQCPRKLFKNVREYEVANGFVKEVS